jgi:hypothetical protein
MAICKLCLQDKKLIKAHITPKGFYRYLYPDGTEHPGMNGGGLLMVMADGSTQVRPIGEYDTGILCSDCDNGIGVYDEYAQKIILKTTPKQLAPRCLAIEQVDYYKLKLFFISLLWRASISDRDYFHHIDTGPFEEILREMIHEKNPGDIHEFSVFFTKFYTNNVALMEVTRKNIMTPIPHKIGGDVNAFLFYFPEGYRIIIKVDERPLVHYSLIETVLAPGKPLMILDAGDYEQSPEFKALLKSVNKKQRK